MKTQDKINVIKDAVIAGYEAKYNHDDICGSVLSTALESGIGFGEISALVKNIGETNGFIVKLVDRKVLAKTDIEVLEDLPLTYDMLVTLIDDAHKAHNVPRPFITNILTGEYNKRKITMPEKSEILEWQKALVDCFIDNPNMNRLDVHDCVVEHKKETSVPKSMLPMLKYMHQQLTEV